MVASLQDYPSTCRQHHTAGNLQILKGFVLLVPKSWFPERGENIGDRFFVLLPDDRIRVEKAKFTAASDLPADRGFSRPHEPDQDNIADGTWEKHSRHSFAVTGRNGQ
jgi:hypothetical protein